LKEIFLKNI